MKVLVFEEHLGMSRHIEGFFAKHRMQTYVCTNANDFAQVDFRDFDVYLHFTSSCLSEMNTDFILRRLPSVFIHCGGEMISEKLQLREGEEAFPFLGDLSYLLQKMEKAIVEFENWSKPSAESIFEFEMKFSMIEKEEASEQICNLIARRYSLSQVIFVDYNSWVDSITPDNVIPLDRRRKKLKKVEMLSNQDLSKNMANNLCLFLDKVPEAQEFYRNEKYQCHLLKAGLEPVGYLIYSSDYPKLPEERYLEYVLKRFAVIYKEKDHYKRIMEESYRDDVTSLYNQKYLPLITDSMIKEAKQTGQNFSVLFIDVDHFKKVNDTRGHLIGSEILAQLANILKVNIREKDYAFRYGGDEFLLLLHNSGSGQAKEIAERIRVQVEAHDFYVQDQVINITLSIGIASFPEHAKTKEEVIALADEAMYSGKNKSRNIVFVAS